MSDIHAEPYGTMATAGTLQLCSFWISSRLFGISILDIKEISNEIALTPIYHAPAAIKGYMNIRGQIHCVADIRYFFGFEKNELGPESRVVLFKPSVDEPFGILVDKMDNVVTIAAQSIEERRKKNDPAGDTPDRRKSPDELTCGVCRLDHGLLVLLNPKGIIVTLENMMKSNTKS